MKEVAFWSQLLIDGLSAIGDFLLYEPFQGVEVLEGFSIGRFIIGAGLIGIITWKVVKFFLP